MSTNSSAAADKNVPVAVRLLSQKQVDLAKKGLAHICGPHIRCKTDTIGHATPENRGPLDLVLDATEGFIPLWDKGVTLRWRFQEQSLTHFADIAAAKITMRTVVGRAVLAWGDAAPVKFTERTDAWDFEIVANESDDCDVNGCVLAKSFFPDAGRHELNIYPRMFQQTTKEQDDTLEHEFGHVFGLRHFFAKVSEKAWPSELFGKHKPFSIMNYGAQSKLTADDKKDLKRLYKMVWAGELTAVNGTPIRLVRPFHES